MDFWLAVVPPVSLALAIACASYPAFRLAAGPRLVVLALVASILLPIPWLVEPDRHFARFVVGVLAVVLVVKLYDLHLGAILGDRPDFRSVFTYLINLTSAVRRKLAEEPRPGFAADLRRFGLAILGAALAGVVYAACRRVDWRPYPFAVEHSVKVVALFLVVEPACIAGAATWRLLGGWTHEPMNNLFIASTPADFWRRYNRIASQFFHENIFKPLGGRRRPAFGMMAVFALSGLMHEYIFDVAAGRIQGEQMTFFLIQGVAVTLTARLKPKGWRRAVGIAATLAFNLATGVLFFASMDEVVPFYQRR